MSRSTRSTRGFRPEWSITVTDVVRTGRKIDYYVKFECIPPTPAQSTSSTVLPKSFDILVDITEQIEQQRVDQDRTAIGPVYADIHRQFIKRYQATANQIASPSSADDDDDDGPRLKLESTEDDVRDALWAHGVPVDRVGFVHFPFVIPRANFIDRIDTRDRPYTVAQVYWEKMTVDDFGETAVDVSASTLQPDIQAKFDSALEHAAGAKSLGSWLKAVEEAHAAEHFYYEQMLKILFVTAVEAFQLCSANAVQAPAVLAVRARFQGLLNGGYNGLFKVNWILRARIVEPDNPADNGLAPPKGQYVRLDVARTDRERGNRETSFFFARNSWNANGGVEDEDYAEDANAFIDRAVDFVYGLAAVGDERTLPECVEHLKQLRDFEKVRRGGVGVGETPHAPRSPAEWAIRRTLFSNTLASRSSAADAASYSRDEACEMLFKRVVSSEQNGAVHVIRSEYSGTVIATMAARPMTSSQYKRYLDEFHNGHSNISLDHEHQVTLRKLTEKTGDVSFVPAYPPAIFGLVLLFFAYDAVWPDWQSSPNQHFHAVQLAYISATITVLYRTWQVPCPRYERLVLPPHIMWDARVEQQTVADLLGLKFHVATTSIESAVGNLSPAQIRSALKQSEDAFRRAIAKICNVAGVELGDSTAHKQVNLALQDPLLQCYLESAMEAGLVTKSRLMQALTSVRPEEREKRQPPAGEEQNITEAGLRFVDEMKLYGIAFKLNAWGIPSLTVTGNDTPADIYRTIKSARTAWTDQKPDAQQSVAECYVHALATQVWAVLGSELGKTIFRANKPQEMMHFLYMARRTSFSVGTVPMHSPYINKGSLAYSPSRLEHGPTGYVTGYTDFEYDSSFEFFNPSRVTFAYDAWCINVMLRGGHASHLEQVKEVSSGAREWALGGAGRGVAETFGLVDGFLSAQRQDYLLDVLEGIVSRNPHLRDDRVVQTALEGLYKLRRDAGGCDPTREVAMEV
ncbi:hypothetical protein Rhopal_004488-T1 [Rhodotorula paludigena]|uniref:Uncharacterized protein n=1 Tax=Rhodotorula paludigena TaxID=86838 RepID=A0AAV5GNK1_9BASI|nr:hypothetical protein Rhopal_004488-T1 [Rhodotorula paludigena]